MKWTRRAGWPASVMIRSMSLTAVVLPVPSIPQTAMSIFMNRFELMRNVEYRHGRVAVPSLECASISVKRTGPSVSTHGAAAISFLETGNLGTASNDHQRFRLRNLVNRRLHQM